MTVKSDYTTELLTMLNVWDCWMRWDCDIRLYNWICWHCWICGTVEWNISVKVDIQANLWKCWMCATVEWDETVISDYTTEFVDTIE